MKINKEELQNSDLVEATFNFWYNDNEHIRSPFPEYIQSKLKQDATEAFFNWVGGVNENAKDEVNDEVISEKFEEIIFELAYKMVLSEDERITVSYPFLPRIGDVIYKNDESKTGESVISDRMIVKEGDHEYLRIILTDNDTKDKWETRFELPK